MQNHTIPFNGEETDPQYVCRVTVGKHHDTISEARFTLLDDAYFKPISCLRSVYYVYASGQSLREWSAGVRVMMEYFKVLCFRDGYESIYPHIDYIFDDLCSIQIFFFGKLFSNDFHLLQWKLRALVKGENSLTYNG